MDNIIKRRHAKLEGRTIYFTGKPCCHGHITVRSVKSGQCLQCCPPRVLIDSNVQKQKRKDYNKKYYSNNKEYFSNHNRKYRQDNLENRQAYCSEWKKKNKEVHACHSRNRHALKLSSGTHSAEDIADIFKMQRKRCAACKSHLKSTGYHVDHIFPIALGGSNYRRNLQLLCPPCNLKKHAKDPIAWAQEQGRLL